MRTPTVAGDPTSGYELLLADELKKRRVWKKGEYVAALDLAARALASVDGEAARWWVERLGRPGGVSGRAYGYEVLFGEVLARMVAERDADRARVR